MAKIRITTALLEHLLDLPEGVHIVTDTKVQGFPVLVMTTEGGPAPFDTDQELALQYEEREAGTMLVSAIPVTD